ncbi:M48 family metalloprotease [Candidatus Zixiibacteriota bacterium]
MPSLSLLVLLALGVLQSGSVIGNSDSKLFHRSDQPHVAFIEHPVMFDSPELAERDGYRPCPVCYYRHPPALRAIQGELLLAGQIDSQVRLHYPMWIESDAEQRLDQSIERVLADWPIPLKGYHYQAALLDSEMPNAVAVPAGQIYMTRGLYQAIESDSELDAVMAFQVAHIEGRHGLRSYESSQGFGTLSRVLTTVAAAPFAIDLSRVIDFAKRVVLAGYSRSYNERALSLMISTLGSPSLQRGARSIFQKLVDLYSDESSASSPFRAIPASAEMVGRLQTIEIIPMDIHFQAVVPRTTGLTASVVITRVVCDGAGCQIYAYLEVLRGGRLDRAEPLLYVLDPSQRGNRPPELHLTNSTGTQIRVQVSIAEKQLGRSTVLGSGISETDLRSFLENDVQSATLVFPFSTVQGGNVTGDRLELIRTERHDH